MKKDELRIINYERMNRWKERLNEHHSTPVMTIGVGHDHLSGRVMILVTEDMPDEAVKLLLLEAISQLNSD